MAGDLSAPQTVTLDNTGTATLQILNLQTSPDFSIASTCSTIVPGASCTLTVSFTPQIGTAATRVSSIEISSNASTSLEFISLAGVSTPSTIGISPASLSFGTVLVGASSTLPLQISNTGTTAATFGAITATGDYYLSTTTCPMPGLTLAPGTSCTVQVVFMPTQSGTRTGTLSVATSASTLPLMVPLTGIGAQSHLQISPSSLNFGSIALGAPAILSLTLTNTGATPITNISTAAVPSSDYAVTVPCATATLTAGASCPITVTFTPSALGARAGTLTILSSDASSPDIIPLTGTGIANGSFTLTVNGAATASATVVSGSGTPATYTLTVTPVNNFSGAVVLNCTPVIPAQYATCSLSPSGVTLSAGAQTAVATLTTVTSIAANTPPAAPHRSFNDTALSLLFPGLILLWKARASRHRAWRRIGPVAWAFVATIALLSSSGCGGGGATTNNANPNLRYAAPGAYQYQVTASSVSGATQITQTVTLNLTIQ